MQHYTVLFVSWVLPLLSCWGSDTKEWNENSDSTLVFNLGIRVTAQGSSGEAGTGCRDHRLGS